MSTFDYKEWGSRLSKYNFDGKLSGDLISSKSIDSVSNDDQAAIYPPEFLN